MKTLSQVILGLSLVFFSSAPASAISFTLNQSTCCGIGPFGTVTLTDVNSTTVDVLVTLAPGVGFVDSGSAAPGNHPDFAFNLSGPLTAVNVIYVQTAGDGWTTYDPHSSPTDMSDSFGTYQFGLYCNGAIACGPGASHPNFGPLEFEVTRAT